MTIFLLINLVVTILSAMLSVAFLTLYERKILSYIQKRKGPNKSSFKGILQPFSDMLKLLTKEMFYLSKSNMFYYSPMLMFLISSILWILYPWIFEGLKLNYSMLMMIFIVSMNVYPILMISWVSSNNYSMISMMRMISQMISFEVLMYLMVLEIMMMINGYSMMNAIDYQKNVKFYILMYPVYFVFILSLLIDLNRVPFDLVEGESELVSGFNVEYYSSLFTMIFLSEYMNVLFMSMILTVIFYGLSYWSTSFVLIYLINLSLLIMIRGVLPRIRYDYLMYTCWMELMVVMTFHFTYIYVSKEIFSMLVM